ncbi:hypothetical protein LIER_03085 [Lithospermum erythrorhizon]|uniref:Uncharacterized protein n=1 Tax=Lithospermum erythrorhizon TaxID=34254 RepID=A0AAV3NSF1_LITER
MRDFKPVNSQSRRSNGGLLRRLFNYAYALFSRHQEFDDHDSHKPMIGVSVVEGSSKHVEIQGNGPSSNSKIRSRGSNLSNEVEIEFRHTEVEQDKWSNALQKDVNGIDRKNGDQIVQNNNKITNGEFQVPVAKKTIEVEGSAGHTHASGKLKKIDGEMKTTRPISSDNNQRSAIEEFLKSRKEAMRRYYSMDQKENH